MQAHEHRVLELVCRQHLFQLGEEFQFREVPLLAKETIAERLEVDFPVGQCV